MTDIKKAIGNYVKQEDLLKDDYIRQLQGSIADLKKQIEEAEKVIDFYGESAWTDFYAGANLPLNLRLFVEAIKDDHSIIDHGNGYCNTYAGKRAHEYFGKYNKE